MNTDWYYFKENLENGPVSSNELLKLAREGKLLPTDFVWKKGASDWELASIVQGLFTEDDDSSASQTPPALPDSATRFTSSTPPPLPATNKELLVSTARKATSQDSSNHENSDQNQPFVVGHSHEEKASRSH